MYRRNNVDHQLHFVQVIASSEDDFFVLAQRARDAEPDLQWSAVLHSDGLRWTILCDLPGVWLTQLCRTGPDSVAAYCMSGMTYECRTDGSCRCADVGVKAANGFRAFGPENYYFVGDRGACLHALEHRVERIDVGTTNHLRDVWGLNEDDLTIVGRKGTCLRLRSGGVQVENVGTRQDLGRVFGDWSGQRLATGLRGSMFRHDGVSWRDISQKFGWGITDVSFNDDGSLLCAGSDLVLVRNDVATLEVDANRFSAELYGVAQLGHGRYIVVGADQTVLIGPPWECVDIAGDLLGAETNMRQVSVASCGDARRERGTTEARSNILVVRASLGRLGENDSPFEVDSDSIAREVSVIANIVQPENVLAILEEAAEGDRFLNRAGIYVLARFAQRPEVANRIRRMLHESDTEDRIWLIQAIGHGPLPHLAAYLNEIAEKEALDSVGRAAVHAAGALKCDINIPTLIGLSARDLGELGNSNLLRSLKEYATAECRPYLRKAFDAQSRKRSETISIGGTVTSYDKIVAAWGLAKLGDSDALRHLIEIVVGGADTPLLTRFQIYAAVHAARALCDVKQWPFDPKGGAENIIATASDRLRSLGRDSGE